MAGGVGSRFWPVSRAAHPKQFIDILGTGKSLLRQTFERFAKQLPAENIYVVTNEAYRRLVKDQLPELADGQILGEPVGRNTAPCIAYASYKIHQQDANATVIVAPSDHLIMEEDRFFECIHTATAFANKEKSLITIGIQPNRPDTGYGYIQYLEKEAAKGVNEVKTFTEKPSLELAKTFIDSGDFLWNAGIFIFKTTTIKQAFEKHLPDMHKLFKDGNKLYGTEEEQAFINQVYEQCSNISIDYGIMEKADNVYVVPGSFGWSDLGTWNSLYDILEKDKNVNALIGKQVKLYESKGNLISVPKNKLVVLKGVKDLIIVEADNILLICEKSREQEVKQIVTDLKLEYGEKYN